MILYTLNGNGYIDIKYVENHKDLKVYDLFTYFVPYESIKVLDSKAWYIK